MHACCRHNDGEEDPVTEMVAKRLRNQGKRGAAAGDEGAEEGPGDVKA